MRPLLVTGWLLTAVLSAQAFERTRDADSGACLWWKQRQVTVVLHERCSQDVPVGNCEQAVWSSLKRWNEPPCSDFRFVEGGTTDRTDVGFDEDHWDDNINLIIWIESGWRHEASALAMTTTTYDSLTGQIVDSDVELNGEAFTFATAGSSTASVDIANTLTHEAGHTVGLDHAADRDATMFGYAPQGETKKRDLAQDDIDGLCHIYPVGQDVPPCDEKPPPDDGQGGCTCTSAGAVARPAAWLVFLALAFFRLSPRKRRRTDCGLSGGR